MLKSEYCIEIIEDSREIGWVLEPDAKRILSMAGHRRSPLHVGEELRRGRAFAGEIGYPVVAKVVSPRALHKTDVGGVIVGIESDEELKEAYGSLSRIEGFEGVLVDETLSGVELIVGAKNDDQFGPVILWAIGGVSVELYKDTAIRMAPLAERDVDSMIRCLKAHELLEGFRGDGAGEPGAPREAPHGLFESRYGDRGSGRVDRSESRDVLFAALRRRRRADHAHSSDRSSAMMRSSSAGVIPSTSAAASLCWPK